MCRSLVVAVLLLVACHGNDPAKPTSGSASPPLPKPVAGGSAVAPAPAQQPAPPTGGSAATPAAADEKPEPAPPGHDFTPIAKELLAVGACGDGGAPESIPPAVLEKHCKLIKSAQDDYLQKWVRPARAFFAEKVPPNLPKKVVYPFAGGDLSTALTVFPDADEITTMSLEPAGDPRTLGTLAAPQPPPKGAKPGTPAAEPRIDPRLERALATIEKELKFLYRVNFSNTLNMIDAMRGGQLPTQLIFGLSALKIHGYEIVSLRYFRIEPDGSLHYLDDDEVAKAPDANSAAAEKRNRVFANAEVRFKKPGGRVQVYRHIQVNLDNEHQKADPRVIKHLEQKGQISAMTKAASYLLSYESFSMIRDYLIDHATWMVSDATGIAPKWGKAKGFEYETYGSFVAPHLPSGNGVAKVWRDEWDAQPKRDLAFRFGYYDKRISNHLVIMRKKP